MRRCTALFVLLGFLLSSAATWAAEGTVCKVLPQFLDGKGRQSLSPSLFERDAYQFYLRRYPKERAALQLTVQWKAKGVDWNNVRLRAEMRGLATNSITTRTFEEPVKKNGWLSNWAEFKLEGQDFKDFGELVAWRVTLWEGDRQLSELKSFLWSGVDANHR